MRTLDLAPLLLFVIPASAQAQTQGSATQTGAGRSRRPNVVLVITDDQGYVDVAHHGNGMIPTPNMDSLEQQSVRLTIFQEACDLLSALPHVHNS